MSLGGSIYTLPNFSFDYCKDKSITHPGDTKSSTLLNLKTLMLRSPIWVLEATFTPTSLSVPVLEFVHVWYRLTLSESQTATYC